MDFKVGDRVIYPNQGIGVITEIFKTDIGGSEEEFYRVRLEAKNSLVMIPLSNAKSIGVRRLCSIDDLTTLFNILENDSIETARDWKDRYKDNVEKMMSGSIFEVAQVLKGLYFLQFQKTLSFREKKMFDRSRQLVIAEIAAVTNAQEVVPQSAMTTIEDDDGPPMVTLAPGAGGRYRLAEPASWPFRRGRREAW